MSDALKSSRAKIRTFALDLAAERQKQGQGEGEEKKSNKEQSAAALIPVPETPQPKAPKPVKPAPIKEPLIKVESKPTEKDRPKQKKEKPTIEPITITEPKVKEPPKMPEAPAKAAPIPAFHELQKASEKSSEKKPNIGFDATVITDTKHKRFRLFPAIVDSIKGWFTDLGKKKVKPKHTYSVPETSHRKGVIQKATTKSGAIFSADSDTIKEQIRRRQQKDEREKESQVEDHEPETTWSPYTDPGYALLDDTDEEILVPDTTQNAAIESKRISEIRHVVAAVSEVPQEKGVGADNAEVEPVTDLDESRWAAGEESPTESAPIVETEPIDLDELTETTDEVEVVDETTPAPTEKDESFLHQFETNTLTLVLLVMVVGFIAVLLVSRVLIGYLNQPNTPESALVIPSSKESVLAGAQVVELSITNDTVDRLAAEALSTTEQAPVGLVELSAVSPIGEEVSPAYFFELLRFRTSPPLRQTVTTARFVTVNNSTPTILLHFTDQETVRGEMLRWEPILAEDFEKLFDLPEIGLSEFEDSVIEGTEVRSISYEDKRVIMYGFIGSNTLLIANDAATFAQIQQLTSDD